MFCTTMNGNSFFFFFLFVVQWGKDKTNFADLDSIKNSHITFPKICFFILIFSPHCLSAHTHTHTHTHTQSLGVHFSKLFKIYAHIIPTCLIILQYIFPKNENSLVWYPEYSYQI